MGRLVIKARELDAFAHRRAISIEQHEIEDAPDSEDISYIDDQIVEETQSLEQINLSIESLLVGIETLSDVGTVLSDSNNATEEELTLAEIASDNAVSGTDLTTSEDVLPSLENYIGTRPSVEGIADTIKKMARGLTNQLGDTLKVTGSLVKTYGKAGKSLKKQIADLQKQVSTLDDVRPESTIRVSAQFQALGDSVIGVSSAKELLSKLKSKEGRLSKNTELMETAGQLAENVLAATKGFKFNFKDGYGSLVSDLSKVYAADGGKLKRHFTREEAFGTKASSLPIQKDSMFTEEQLGNVVPFSNIGKLLAEDSNDIADGDRVWKFSGLSLDAARIAPKKQSTESITTPSKNELSTLLDYALMYVDSAEKTGALLDKKILPLFKSAASWIGYLLGTPALFGAGVVTFAVSRNARGVIRHSYNVVDVTARLPRKLLDRDLKIAKHLVALVEKSIKAHGSKSKAEGSLEDMRFSLESYVGALEACSDNENVARLMNVSTEGVVSNLVGAVKESIAQSTVGFRRWKAGSWEALSEEDRIRGIKKANLLFFYHNPKYIANIERLYKAVEETMDVVISGGTEEQLRAGEKKCAKEMRVILEAAGETPDDSSVAKLVKQFKRVMAKYVPEEGSVGDPKAIMKLVNIVDRFITGAKPKVEKLKAAASDVGLESREDRERTATLITWLLFFLFWPGWIIWLVAGRSVYVEGGDD